MARKRKKSLTKAHKNPKKQPTGIPPRLWSQVQKQKGRYVAVKIKDYVRYRGPTRKVLGSANTKKGAEKVIDKGGHSGKHAVIDKKTGKYWIGYVARTYKVTVSRKF